MTSKQQPRSAASAGFNRMTNSDLDALFETARRHPAGPERFAELLRAVPSPLRRRPRLWQTAGALLATAAVIGTVLLVLAPPDPPRAFALSRVAAAMRAAQVVRQETDRGVFWESRGRFVARKNADGTRVSYMDMERQRYTSFDAERGCIMISSCEQITLPQGLRGPYTLDELITQAESWGRSFDEHWIRRDFVSDGQQRIELVAKQTEAAGVFQISKVLIDATTGRILRTESEDSSCEYSYPDTPPQDIYDLGVPRDAPVVDGTASKELFALRDKVLSAMRPGFGAYRMVSLSNVGGSGMRRVITDGRRYRVESAFYQPTPDWTVEEMRRLAKEHIASHPLTTGPRIVAIFDGESETAIHFDADNRPQYRSLRPRGFESGSTQLLDLQTWGRSVESGFFHIWPDHQAEFIGPNEIGLVGMRIRGQANNVKRPYLFEWWFDPNHGYARAGGRSFHYPDAPWQLKKNWQTGYHNPFPPADAPAEGAISEMLEWAELRKGQWYPRLRVARSVVLGADGLWREREEPNRVGFRAVARRYILAEPLEHVDDVWFRIPDEWIKDVPMRP
ncbi:MAG: hypothetical protein IH986_14395 [Planctomycetes bacterium]|nr:hypothetical protein [Planctomycetota bacterium]